MSEKPFLLPCYSKLHTTALELNTFWNRKVPEFLCICILTMCKKLLRFQKEFNSVMWHSFHYDTKKIKNNEYRKGAFNNYVDKMEGVKKCLFLSTLRV